MLWFLLVLFGNGRFLVSQVLESETSCWLRNTRNEESKNKTCFLLIRNRISLVPGNSLGFIKFQKDLGLGPKKNRKMKKEIGRLSDHRVTEAENDHLLPRGQGPMWVNCFHQKLHKTWWVGKLHDLSSFSEAQCHKNLDHLRI